MKNKKLINEDLKRFNQIMGYNPSKGLIKEEGEQLSMDFPPAEMTPEEQEVSDALDAMVSFMEKNLKEGYARFRGIDNKGLFYRHTLYGNPREGEGKYAPNSFMAYVERIKAQLKGDIKKRGGWSRSQTMGDKLGRQKIIPFNKGEVNNLEEFLNLLDFITNSLGILGIDYSEIELLGKTLRHRVKSDREEEERLSDIDFQECPSCEEFAYEPGYGCENCGYLSDEDY